ncbi:MAG: serine protease [Acidobacteriota bacterium]
MHDSVRFARCRRTLGILIAVGCALLMALPALASGAAPEASAAQQGPVQIGEVLDRAFASPRELPPLREAREEPTAVPVWRDEIHVPNATYVAPYFSRFELPRGDYVIVRSPDHRRSWRYEGLGKGDLGITGGFWGIHIPGDRAIVELYSASRDGRFGYEIDRVARGFTRDELTARYGADAPIFDAKDDPTAESICGADDSREARCYGGVTYDRARAVARLLINGTGWCTGWLIGSEGHIITNQHCIGSGGDATNTDFEFMAEGANCATNCRFDGACAGTVEATTSTLVQIDVNLDYALVRLPTNVTGTYGFLQLRRTGAINGERIYIPQHPLGWGKRIAWDSSHPQNPGGFAEVDSLTAPRCGGAAGNDIEYYADTRRGSSGSPVLATADNLVIALHHCRGDAACTANGGDGNRGVPIEDIIADLGTNLPDDALGCRWPDGHASFCRDCGPCRDGEGDCDGNGECIAGTTCENDVGPNYGWASWVDVCVRPANADCLEDCARDYADCQVDFCYYDYDAYMCSTGCSLEFQQCRNRCG